MRGRKLLFTVASHREGCHTSWHTKQRQKLQVESLRSTFKTMMGTRKGTTEQQNRTRGYFQWGLKLGTGVNRRAPGPGPRWLYSTVPISSVMDGSIISPRMHMSTHGSQELTENPSKMCCKLQRRH